MRSWISYGNLLRSVNPLAGTGGRVVGEGMIRHERPQNRCVDCGTVNCGVRS